MLGHDRGRRLRTASTPCTTSPLATASSASDSSLPGIRIAEDLQRLLQRRQILVPDEHGGGLTVTGEHDAFVLTLGAVDELRQVVAHRPERLGGHGHNCGMPPWEVAELSAREETAAQEETARW